MNIFLTIAVTLGLAALFSFINERLVGMPQTIGLMVLSLIFTVTLALLETNGLTMAFEEEKALVSVLPLDETLLNGVLCFMLFAGSINVSSKALDREGRVILSLAIGATLIATVLIGVSIWWAMGVFGVGLSLAYAIVFGALISPTDPIAALGILGKIGLPDRLQSIINGESLFNDGVGVVLFTIALAVAVNAAIPSISDAVLLFFREVLGAVALGFGSGMLMHAMLSRSSDFGTHLLVSLAIVSLAYALAEQIEVSGPIATVLIGLIVGNTTMPHLAKQNAEPFKVFWRAVDDVANAVLFVLIGMHLAIVQFPDHFASVALASIALCLVSRWISVWLPLVFLKAGGRLDGKVLGLTNLLTWGGLRGGLALAMVLSLPNGPDKALLLFMTYCVVAFSIVCQGLTIGVFFSKSKLEKLVT